MAHPFAGKKDSERETARERYKECGGKVTNDAMKRAKGGMVPMKGGAESGQGRLDKIKAYGAK
jgi:hypothetical protein